MSEKGKAVITWILTALLALVYVVAGFPKLMGSAPIADRFVALYVNRWTLDFGPPGRLAVEEFLGAMRRADLIPDDARVEFVSPAVPA